MRVACATSDAMAATTAATVAAVATAAWAIRLFMFKALGEINNKEELLHGWAKKKRKRAVVDDPEPSTDRETIYV